MFPDVVIKINYIVCYLPRKADDQFLIPIASRPRPMLHQYPNIRGGAKIVIQRIHKTWSDDDQCFPCVLQEMRGCTILANLLTG